MHADRRHGPTEAQRTCQGRSGQQRSDQTRAGGALIGASDAAAALGLDSYRSPLSVWRRLRGLDSEAGGDAGLVETVRGVGYRVTDQPTGGGDGSDP